MVKMKDSGVEWLGTLPETWEVSQIGQCYDERREKVSDKDYPPLSVTMNGILPQLSTAAKTDAHDDRKLVKKGDFAINSRSDRRGSCGISPCDGSVSLINTILKPRDEMHPGYYNWLFHTSMFADEFYKWGHGIVDDLWTTNWQEMKKIYVPAPPLEEQAVISDYLDKECARIDSVIEKTRESIEEYKKLKQSIITEAVTKGIRPNREMKDSENEWIGRIPKDWEITRLKYVVDESFKGFGITKEEVFQDGETPCVRYGEIYSKYSISFENSFSMTKKNVLSTTRWFSYGDVLCAGTGELIEEIGKSIVYLGKERCLAGGDIIVLRHSQNPLFMGYLLNSAYVQEQRSCGKTKLKVVHISEPEIKNVWIAVPPIEEQIEIATWLHDKCDSIDLVIKNKEFELTELLKYKKSLIYEYVTGKKRCLVAKSDY